MLNNLLSVIVCCMYIKMSEELEALRSTVMASLYKCAENSVLYLGEERTASLNKLRDHVATYCALDAQQKVAKDALENAKRETDSSNIDSLEEKFKERLKKMSDKQSNPDSHPYMQSFNKKVSTALQQRQQRDNLDESDLAMTESPEQFIDPITKKPIENPVKNRKCGHVYEHQSILQLLKTSKRLRCPVAGCGDKSPIVEADLISDEELRFRIALTQHSTMAEERSFVDLDSTR